MKKMLSVLLIVILFLVWGVFVIADEQGRGCCSYHGGVCDCVGGRVVCCDGTYSPSCRC